MLAAIARALRPCGYGLLICCLAASTAIAQHAPVASARVRELARHAAIIFRGTVLAVEPLPAESPDGMSSLRITFKVGEAVRGTTAGQTLTIREWQGLWDSSERYRAGEELILFLHAPSPASGMSSPVGGDAGRLLVDRYGMVELGVVGATFAGSEMQDGGGVEEEPRPRGKVRRLNRKELMRLAREAVEEY